MQITRDITGGQRVTHAGRAYQVYRYEPPNGDPSERVFLVPVDGGAVISALWSEVDAPRADRVVESCSGPGFAPGPRATSR
jgi:hypothetical protein